MRKIILSATTVVALALGAGGAYAMGGGNASPEASPYAIIEPQTVAPLAMSEGRAALVGDDWRYAPGAGVAPAPFMAPLPQNSVSHGR